MNAQSNWKEFWKQSSPIKSWIITHPFKAKKARIISHEAVRISDSIAKTNLLDGDKFGGQVDAFRHAYWMAALHQNVGKNASKSLGLAYERSNKKTYKKQLRKGKEPSYDEVSKQMDLFNNAVGLKFTQKNAKISKESLIYQIVKAIKQGEFRMLKKDTLGNFLNCKNEIIPKNELQKWKSKKCLIPSNN